MQLLQQFTIGYINQETRTGGVAFLNAQQVENLMTVWQAVMIIAKLVVNTANTVAELWLILTDTKMAIRHLAGMVVAIVSIAWVSVAWGVMR